MVFAEVRMPEVEVSESSSESSGEPEDSSLLLIGPSLVGVCRSVVLDVGGILEMANLEKLDVGGDMWLAEECVLKLILWRSFEVIYLFVQS